MATFAELYAIGSAGNTPLRDKVAVANHIIAVGICKEASSVTNSSTRKDSHA